MHQFRAKHLQPFAQLFYQVVDFFFDVGSLDRKSTRLNSSHGYISYAVFCLKKKKYITIYYTYMWNLQPARTIDIVRNFALVAKYMSCSHHSTYSPVYTILLRMSVVVCRQRR